MVHKCVWPQGPAEKCVGMLLGETYMVCLNTRTRRQTSWIAVGWNVTDIIATRSHVAAEKKCKQNEVVGVSSADCWVRDYLRSQIHLRGFEREYKNISYGNKNEYFPTRIVGLEKNLHSQTLEMSWTCILVSSQPQGKILRLVAGWQKESRIIHRSRQGLNNILHGENAAGYC